MGIKQFFKDKLDPRTEEERKFFTLLKAVKAQDLGRVNAALADGADASYWPKNHYGARPLEKALELGDVKIFAAILATPGGLAVAATREIRPSVTLKKSYSEEVWFTPSYLYTAISQGKQEIALMLAKHPGIDIARNGEIRSSSYGLDQNVEYIVAYNKTIKPMADIAREKGMHDVLEVVAERMKPIEAERQKQVELKQLAKAAELREQAEKMLREAEALAPAPKPATPSNKFNV